MDHDMELASRLYMSLYLRLPSQPPKTSSDWPPVVATIVGWPLGDGAWPVTSINESHCNTSRSRTPKEASGVVPAGKHLAVVRFEQGFDRFAAELLIVFCCIPAASHPPKTNSLEPATAAAQLLLGSGSSPEVPRHCQRALPG